jgi:hypothetical protein
MQGFNAEYLQEKWAPILNHEGLGGIQDAHKRMVTAVLLENQERILREERQFLSEAPTNAVHLVTAGFSAVHLHQRWFRSRSDLPDQTSMPNLVAYDLAGVQPMNGPTGLIFAMRSRYTSQSELKHCSTKQTLHSLVRNQHLQQEWAGSDGASGYSVQLKVVLTLVSEP